MMRTTIVSFGYKYGMPRDVDVVFDCRFLPNPHWVAGLRDLSGLDEPVRDFVLGNEETVRFIAEVVDMLAWQLPAFEREGKSYLSVAFGCTGVATAPSRSPKRLPGASRRGWPSSTATWPDDPPEDRRRRRRARHRRDAAGGAAARR